MWERGGAKRAQASNAPEDTYDPAAYWQAEWAQNLEPNDRRRVKKIGRRITQLYFDFDQIEQPEQVNGLDLTDKVNIFYLGQGSLSDLAGFSPHARKLFALLCNFNVRNMDQRGSTEFLASELSTKDIVAWLSRTSFRHHADLTSRPLLLGGEILADAAIHNPQEKFAEMMLHRAQNVCMGLGGMFKRPFIVMRAQRIYQDCSFELMRRQIIERGEIGRDHIREARGRTLEEVRQTKRRMENCTEPISDALGYINEDIVKLGLRLDWLRNLEAGNYEACTKNQVFSAFSRQDHAKAIFRPNPHDPDLRQSADVCRLSPNGAFYIQCKLSSHERPNARIITARGVDVSDVIARIDEVTEYMPKHESQIFRSFWGILAATEDILATNDTLRALYGFIDEFGEDIRIARKAA